MVATHFAERFAFQLEQQLHHLWIQASLQNPEGEVQEGDFAAGDRKKKHLLTVRQESFVLKSAKSFEHCFERNPVDCVAGKPNADSDENAIRDCGRLSENHCLAS